MSTDHRYPPLMSPRSPSYERARQEWLHPSPVGDSQVVAILEQLCEAEHNARRACARAEELLKDASLQRRAHDDAATHEARCEALARLIDTLGGSAPRPEECREILNHGAEAVGRGNSDLEVMEVLRVMRGELGDAYNEAIASPYLDETRRAALVRMAPSITDATND